MIIHKDNKSMPFRDNLGKAFSYIGISFSSDSITILQMMFYLDCIKIAKIHWFGMNRW